MLPGADLSIFAKAVPLLLRNPSIIVVPLLMAVIGLLLVLSLGPGGGVAGEATSGIAGLIVRLLQLFGLGAACIIADDAWRHGRASFDNGWTEARRRGGEILFAAIGFTLLLAVASYAAQLLPVPYLFTVLSAAVVFFLIWAIPAAAVGGVPGAAAIQISIDRVRANPLSAALSTIALVGLVVVAVPYLSGELFRLLLPYTGASLVVILLVNALLEAIAIGYVALVITKTYTDASFSGRRW